MAFQESACVFVLPKKCCQSKSQVWAMLCILMRMKDSYKERQTQLISKMNEGKVLTPDEESWLDRKGNLTESELCNRTLTSY
ncbi:hypothetical protein VP01_416g4 [Puccinia sorghi]|uniref:Uncharacterized protein n=1 Tax=Puccinia sorghi TaxID=27349 RepID=A0A0L6UQX7_9BASI|nr:hypothetical protein VP01_416g4 [Puccinia sorghi]